MCRSVPIVGGPSSLVPSRASGAGGDLWAQALKSLSDSERTKLLDGLNTTTPAAGTAERATSHSLPDLLEQLCHAAARKKKLCDDKSWRFDLHGRKYNMRDVASKVIVWVNLFKQVGDMAIQHDPGHAALPWAGVRFLLEVGAIHKPPYL
jgi:hypothetical protein